MITVWTRRQVTRTLDGTTGETSFVERRLLPSTHHVPVRAEKLRCDTDTHSTVPTLTFPFCHSLREVQSSDEFPVQLGSVGRSLLCRTSGVGHRPPSLTPPTCRTLLSGREGGMVENETNPPLWTLLLPFTSLTQSSLNPLTQSSRTLTTGHLRPCSVTVDPSPRTF